MSKDKNQRQLVNNRACRERRWGIKQDLKAGPRDPHLAGPFAYRPNEASEGGSVAPLVSSVPNGLGRRSRLLRVSAGQRELITSAARPIQCSGGARIQFRCMHQIVGIAPVSLLFHASDKKGGDLSFMTNGYKLSPSKPNLLSSAGRMFVTFYDLISAIANAAGHVRHVFPTNQVSQSTPDNRENL